MISNWTERDHLVLASLFAPAREYAGYKPEVREAPNGDTKLCPNPIHTRPIVAFDCEADCVECDGTGRVPNVDAEGVCPYCDAGGNVWTDDGANPCRICNGTRKVGTKRYLHVADKYAPPAWAREYQDRAYAQACRVAEVLRVPREYWPMPSTGALRVLEYPPGAGTVEHTDFDLFTIVLWRSTPADLEMCNPKTSIGGPHNWGSVMGTLKPEAEQMIRNRERAHAMSPGLHVGEIGELVGLGPATPHRVPARPYVQKSIVYFALPAHDARLPAGTWPDGLPSTAPTVGSWLAARMARSRVYT
jgi:hypothetical protein